MESRKEPYYHQYLDQKNVEYLKETTISGLKQEIELLERKVEILKQNDKEIEEEKPVVPSTELKSESGDNNNSDVDDEGFSKRDTQDTLNKSREDNYKDKLDKPGQSSGTRLEDTEKD